MSLEGTRRGASLSKRNLTLHFRDFKYARTRAYVCARALSPSLTAPHERSPPNEFRPIAHFKVIENVILVDFAPVFPLRAPFSLPSLVIVAEGVLGSRIVMRRVCQALKLACGKGERGVVGRWGRQLLMLAHVKLAGACGATAHACLYKARGCVWGKPLRPLETFGGNAPWKAYAAEHPSRSTSPHYTFKISSMRVRARMYAHGPCPPP